MVGPAQAIHAGHQGGGSGELGVTRHWTTYARRASHAPTPMDRHIALCPVLVDIDGDAIHPPTHALLAVLRGRCRSGPPGWDVVRQAQDRLPRTGRHLQGPRAAEARLLLVQGLLVPERRFPVPFQRTGDEAVFGRDGLVWSGRPLCLGAGARKPLVPMGLSALAFSAPHLLRRHTQL